MIHYCAWCDGEIEDGYFTEVGGDHLHDDCYNEFRAEMESYLDRETTDENKQ